jgi:hypothetical protein
MSEQSTSAIPEAPKTSRRAILAGLAASATPLAPALASSLSGPTPAGFDPIFAVIAEHRAAIVAYRDACHNRAAEDETSGLSDLEADAFERSSRLPPDDARRDRRTPGARR